MLEAERMAPERLICQITYAMVSRVSQKAAGLSLSQLENLSLFFKDDSHMRENPYQKNTSTKAAIMHATISILPDISIQNSKTLKLSRKLASHLFREGSGAKEGILLVKLGRKGAAVIWLKN